MGRLPCFLCTHWVDDAVIGEAAALVLLDEHKRTAHVSTFPKESKLFVLPPLQSGLAIAAALPADAPLSVAGRLQVEIDIARLDGAFAPEEPDDDEARAYLDALRMVARYLDDANHLSGTGNAVILADIRRVAGLYGRTLELGGAVEGHS